MGARNIGPYGSDTYMVIGGSRVDLDRAMKLIVRVVMEALKAEKEAEAENSDENYRFNY